MRLDENLDANRRAGTPLPAAQVEAGVSGPVGGARQVVQGISVEAS
ncbi:hypothetical protein [Streptomyces sp. NPDC002644]